MILMILLGLVSGIISGMGIGGGAILIPALVFFVGMEQQAAQNINLIYFVPTAVIALITHVKNKSVETEIVWKIVWFGIAGALGGAILAINLDGTILRKMFGAFLLVMGIMELFKKEDKESQRGLRTNQ